MEGFCSPDNCDCMIRSSGIFYMGRFWIMTRWYRGRPARGIRQKQHFWPWHCGADVSPEALRREMPRLGELPFDSGRKRMSTLHRCDGSCVLFTKGAPDILMERTDQILTKSGIRPLSPEQKKQIRQQNERWGSRRNFGCWRWRTGPWSRCRPAVWKWRIPAFFLGMGAMLVRRGRNQNRRY